MDLKIVTIFTIKFGSDVRLNNRFKSHQLKVLRTAATIPNNRLLLASIYHVMLNNKMYLGNKLAQSHSLTLLAD